MKPNDEPLHELSESIANRVESVVRGLFLRDDPHTTLTADQELIETGVADSLGLMQLAMALEIEFSGLTIADDDINAATLGSIAAMERLVVEGIS